jgi:protease I
MENKINNKKAAILASDGFEQSEFEMPLAALKNEGISVDVISINQGIIKGWKETRWGDDFQVNLTINNAHSSDYDLLVLPGGVINSDFLRTVEPAVKFVTDFLEQEKPIAAICHAPWILVETGLLKGKRLTSYKSIKTDLKNAGAIWIDEEVVVDKNLITSRSPKDLPAFCKKMIDFIEK